jgi:hypothetical protein
MRLHAVHIVRRYGPVGDMEDLFNGWPEGAIKAYGLFNAFTTDSGLREFMHL